MPVYKKRATKVKKAPRIAQTQRTKVKQQVVVVVEQPKPQPRVRRAAPRAMGRDYQLKALLTRPMMPTPIQTGFDAAEVARQIASQEKKLNEVLESNAMRVMREQQQQQPGYYGTQVLQMAPPVPQPEAAMPAPPTETPPPPPPPPAPMTEVQKEAAQAIKVAADELDSLKSKKTQASFLGLTDEELEAARKKLKRPGTRQPKKEKEEEEPSSASAMSKAETPQMTIGGQPVKNIGEQIKEEKEKESPSKQKPGPKPRPEGTFDRKQMDKVREWVKGESDPPSKTLKSYAKALGVKPPKGLDARGAGGIGNRRAFAKKLFDKLKAEGIYESNEP